MSRRCSPSPTACVAATPTSPSPPSAPRPASRAGWCPSAGYPLLTVPKVPLPRRPSADLLRLPDEPAHRGRRCRAGHRPDAGAGRRRLRWLRLHPRLHRRPATRHTRRHPRAERPTRAGQPARCPHHAVRRHDVREHLAAARHPDRACRCAARSASSTARRRAPRGWPHFGLEDHWPTVLVTGGSLGAQRLNSAFQARAGVLRAAGVQVLHLTGAGKEFVPEVEGPGAPYVTVPYADRMDLAYAAADLVVARAGANTVCELTAVGLPAVYVPLPIGNGEQRFNAADVVAAGGGVIVDDAALSPGLDRHRAAPARRGPRAPRGDGRGLGGVRRPRRRRGAGRPGGPCLARVRSRGRGDPVARGRPR